MKNTKKSFLIRSYIILLMLSLAVKINLFPIKFLSVHSVPLPLFIFLVGMSFGLIYHRDSIRFLRERIIIFIFIILFLLSGILSAWLSPFPMIPGLKSLFQYALFFGISLQLLFLLSLEGEKAGVFFLKILMGFAVLLACISFFEVTHQSLSRFLSDTFRGGDYQVIDGRVRAAATLSHSNIFGCFMSLGIMVFLYLKGALGIKAKVFYPIVAILSVAMALSGSRNAAFVLLVPLLLLLFNRKAVKTSACVIGIAILALVVLAPSSSRFSDVWEIVAKNEKRYVVAGEAFNTAATRPLLWQGALAMFRDYPLTGVGPGNCNQAMKYYAPASLLAVEKEKIYKDHLNAHNGFFNILAEFGFLGMVVALACALYLAISFIRHYGLFPPSPVHALMVGVFLPFIPDAFFYEPFYMVTVLTLLFLFTFPGNLLSGPAGPAPSDKPAC